MAEMRKRLLVLAHLAEGESEIDVCIYEARVETKGITKLGHCLLIEARGLVGHAKVMTNIGIVGVEGEGLLVFCNGLLVERLAVEVVPKTKVKEDVINLGMMNLFKPLEG